MIQILARVIVGLIVIFLPGFLLSLILFKKMGVVERLCVAFGLSVSIIVFLGFFLSGIGYFLKFKGITTGSVYLSLLILCVMFAILAKKSLK
jgi:uncharacterized membrane protein